MAGGRYARTAAGHVVVRLVLRYLRRGGVEPEHGPSSRDGEQRDEQQAKRALAQLDRLLAVLDGHLAKQAWIVGASYSLADLVVGSVLGYTAFLGAPIASHRHVQAWLDKCRRGQRCGWNRVERHRRGASPTPALSDFGEARRLPARWPCPQRSGIATGRSGAASPPRIFSGPPMKANS